MSFFNNMKMFDRDKVVVAVYARYTLLAYEAVGKSEVKSFYLFFVNEIVYDRLIVDLGLNVTCDRVEVKKFYFDFRS